MIPRLLLPLLLLLALGVAASQEAPRYLDPDAPVAERVADLLARMTLEEKVGQMTQIDLARLMGSGEWDRGPLDPLWLERILGDAHVGSLLSGGGAAPVPNEPAAWKETIDALQRYAIRTSRLGIPILYGVDAVHGHNNVLGATIYPHGIGLAATFDPDLVRAIGRAVGEDVAATGVTWNFAPVADLGRDPRWGRFYETFGESPAVAAAMVAAFVEGQASVGRVASTLKHFVAYGQAESGNDRAPADLSGRSLRGIHLPPFAAGVHAGARTVMIASGSVNGVPVHASRYLLTDVLREELGFDGVASSDWGDVDKLVTVHRVAPDLDAAVAMAVNAGVDVVMVPHDAEGFTSALLRQVRAGEVSEARIDEAAGRVLALKFALGLFERPYVDTPAAAAVVETDRSLARRAATESLTLLENRGGALPITGARRVLVTGPGASDVAMQMGGWTIRWQGLEPGGDEPPAVTVLEGLRAGAPEGTRVEHRTPHDPGLLDVAATADAVVVVLGEAPYAEGAGDSDDLAIPEDDAQLVARLEDALEGRDAPLVTVLMAGRPLLLPAALRRASDALVMAYLPGTEAGTALADVLYGRVAPSGRLPFAWPASVGGLPITADEPPAEAEHEPLYPFGHGLSYGRFRTSELAAERDGDEVRLSVMVENAGDKSAEHVVLAHVRFPIVRILTPERLPVGFARVALDPGESRRVDVRVPLERLALVPGDVRAGDDLAVLPGTYRFEVGGESTEVSLDACSIRSRDGSVACR